MGFPFGRDVFRLRAEPVTDPYDPDREIPGDWSTPSVLSIPGAFVAQTSTSMTTGETRAQALEAKSLFCDGHFDVRQGDRVFVGVFDPPLPPGSTSIPTGTLFTGATYEIDGIPPDADSNPWTGWTPPREIPLRRYVG